MSSRRRLRVLAAVCAALALVASCSGSAPTTDRPAPGRTAPSPSTMASRAESAVTAQERLRDTADQIVQRRAQAVLDKDQEAWLADVDTSNAALVRRQRRLFTNLVQLPLQHYTLEVLEATWPSDFAAPRFRSDAYIPYVEQLLQLRGFDSQPVATTHGITFAPVKGRLTIVSDNDVADREPGRSRDAPWDLTRIVVRRSPHALGIFDRTSVASAGRLLSWTEEGVRVVSARVPLRWRGNVVFYAFSDTRVLRRMGTRFLDRAAIAFPVVDDADRPTRRVSTRVIVNPRYLPRNAFQGTYLLSHEITHVALGRTSPWTPAWLQEGLADFVATRGADRSRWVPAQSSVARARRGVTELPRSTFFGDKDPDFDYDVSLAACAYLAGRFGERRLWRLLDRMAAAGRAEGDAEAHADEVLTAMFRIDGRTLARESGRLLLDRAS
jgi:hypothetical protein